MQDLKKSTRILQILYSLLSGEEFNRRTFCAQHKISLRTLDRDVADIRAFLQSEMTGRELIYMDDNSYYLTGELFSDLSSSEIYCILKILFASRAFPKDEMFALADLLCHTLPQSEQKKLSVLLQGEKLYYQPLLHNQPLIKIIHDLSRCIEQQKTIVLHYKKHQGKYIDREIHPISLLFSEYYFYLIAYRTDKKYTYPAFFRVDRIHSFEVTKKTYPYSLKSKYIAGEKKNTLYFMTAGELSKITLECTNYAKEAVFDRIPNAEIISEEGGVHTIQGEVFLDGFVRWVMGQGDAVKIISPDSVKDKIRKEISKLQKIYGSE